MIGRRYRRLLDEDAELPQLIVVDGGKGQPRFAYETLLRLGIADRVAIVGLAKRIEEVYFPHDSTPYYLDRNSEALKVLMHIRDEAHRFGITFHRKKRSLAFIKSELESIPTLGKPFGRETAATLPHAVPNPDGFRNRTIGTDRSATRRRSDPLFPGSAGGRHERGEITGVRTGLKNL